MITNDFFIQRCFPEFVFELEDCHCCEHLANIAQNATAASPYLLNSPVFVSAIFSAFVAVAVLLLGYFLNRINDSRKAKNRANILSGKLQYIINETVEKCLTLFNDSEKEYSVGKSILSGANVDLRDFNKLKISVTHMFDSEKEFSLSDLGALHPKIVENIGIQRSRISSHNRRCDLLMGTILENQTNLKNDWKDQDVSPGVKAENYIKDVILPSMGRIIVKSNNLWYCLSKFGKKKTLSPFFNYEKTMKECSTKHWSSDTESNDTKQKINSYFSSKNTEKENEKPVSSTPIFWIAKNYKKNENKKYNIILDLYLERGCDD